MPTNQPIGLLAIARKLGYSVEEVREVFAEHFGSYEAYVQLCLEGKIHDALTEMVEQNPQLAEEIKKRGLS